MKEVYGGVIDILIKDRDVNKAISFIQSCVRKLANKEYPIRKLIISKSLRGFYKNPKQIAHKVLADRMSERDPGNKPKSNDRIPYAYIQVNDSPIITGYKKVSKRVPDGFYKNGKPKLKTIKVDGEPKYKKRNILQGDRIEHIDFIHKNNISLDYEFYITNQIMNPVKQVLDLEMDSNETIKLFSKH